MFFNAETLRSAETRGEGSGSEHTGPLINNKSMREELDYVPVIVECVNCFVNKISKASLQC